MSKSSPSGIPGVSMMTDTLDFFKNMWENAPGMNMPGMRHIPGMVMPTLSVDEIEKQIKDLKAVESWLTLNLNMLQGTIQALEVQKTTISTLQSMSESFTAAMQATPASAEAGVEKSAFQSPFAASAAAWGGAAAKPAPTEKPVGDARTAPEKTPAPEEKPAVQEKAAASPAIDPTAAMADAMQPLANPAAWWGMLQNQFKQAVDTAAAMTLDAGGTATAEAKPAAKPKAAAKKATQAKAKPAAAPRKRKVVPKE